MTAKELYNELFELIGEYMYFSIKSPQVETQLYFTLEDVWYHNDKVLLYYEDDQITIDSNYITAAIDKGIKSITINYGHISIVILWGTEEL